MSSDSVSRKDFVAAIGALTTATAVPQAAEAAVTERTHSATQPHIAPHHAAPPLKPLGSNPEAYITFTGPEARFVEAAVERLIPADDLSPGAREAGVAYFIDQQLDGQYGYAAKMYRQGPWGQGTPTQGYQLALTPRDVYRIGIDATNAYCAKQYGKTFDALHAAQQDEVLNGLEAGTIALDDVPAKTFFAMLFENTTEGFFADPVYGGNRNKIGWKLVGFPGVPAAYVGYIEDHNKPYHAEPMGIADIERSVGMTESGAMSMRPAHLREGRS